MASKEVALLNCSNRQNGKSDSELKRASPPWGVPLLEADYANLEASWISGDIADAAMMRRVDDLTGREILGQKGKRDCSGILIPYFWPENPNLFSYRVRRDYPEYVSAQDGKPKPDRKYLAAPQSGNHIFVPPGLLLQQLADVKVALVLVEGEKKALALSRLALYETPTLRFVSIAIAGVWNWRGITGKTGGPKGERLDVSGPIPDLDRIVWKGRTAYIVFDVNVATNASVRWARQGIARELGQRGANVRFVNIPEDCGVNGIDDLLAAWGPTKVLELFGKSIPGSVVSVVAPPQFQSRPEGMFRITGKDEQRLSQVQLSTYRAAITKNIRLDDGVEMRREFEITAELMGRTFRFTIPASEFARMEWPIEKLGQGAVTYPNQREYARAAVQFSSLTAEESCIYTHTGWRNIDGQWFFLHAGGAIGKAGAGSDVHIQLSGPMRLYELALPPNREVLISAIRASLQLIDLAPPAISFALLATTYRAAMGQADFGIHLVGETGAFKSELAALQQQHFGPAMKRLNLPAAWSSTGNALEALAFLAKDALLVIDDFAPQGSPGDIARYHASADRVFRAAGNQAGRGRLDSSAKLRESKPPRALILSTGEDIPRGHSIRARLLILELPKKCIDSIALARCQKDAASGLFAQSMGAFVQYAAANYDSTLENLNCAISESRSDSLSGVGHARTPDIIANLQAAFALFLQFAEQAGAIDFAKRQDLTARCAVALREAAMAQSKHHGVSDPAKRFIVVLGSLLASGRVHLQSRDGGTPLESPQCCGWRKDTNGNWCPLGTCVGWVHDADIFLNATAAFSAVQNAGRDSGEILSVSEHTLRKRLHENGFLASVDKARETLTVRRNIAGGSQTVLHFLRNTLVPEVSDADEDVA